MSPSKDSFTPRTPTGPYRHPVEDTPEEVSVAITPSRSKVQFAPGVAVVRAPASSLDPATPKTPYNLPIDHCQE